MSRQWDSRRRLADLLERGAIAEAEMAAAQLRVQFPQDVEYARLHGLALLQLGRRDEALDALRRARELAPDDVDAVCNLATAMVANEQTNAAIEMLRGALKKSPGHPAILLTLGNALMGAARYSQARESYAMATHGAPEHPGLRLNLAAAELELGHAEQALRHIQEALQLEPNFDSAYELLGLVFRSLGKRQEAAQAFLQAEKISPENPRYPLQAGIALDDIGQLEAALQAYARALRLDASSGLALSQLIFTKRRLYDWVGLDDLSTRLHRAVAEQRPGITPFSFLAEAGTPAEQLRCASTFAEHTEAQTDALRRQLAFTYPSLKAASPWRVGMVSNGFGEHPVGRMIVALVEALRGDELELHLFATSPDDGGPVRQRLQAAATLHDVSTMSPADCATHIHATDIEILFDLRTFGSGSNVDLFELQPAPIQVNWLGFPATSGAPWMDYLLADAVALPSTMRKYISEKVIRLPRSFLPCDASAVIAQVPTRQACGLPAQGTVFASFNSSYKLDPATFARFMLILQQVPGSVLWLQSGPERSDERLRLAASTLDIAPERLIFMPQLPHADYLACYAHADLFLDTTPYNAQATAIDALRAGCPVLTLPGQGFAGRVGASLLFHAGLPELIAEDDEGFVGMATELGTDREALDVVRRHLVQAREKHPLFDIPAFAADFRRAIQGMSARHRIGRPPADIDLGGLL
ncbi:tetratricopeptide repeat protein [Dyella sp.]|uniref:O-linked N-acetylglucosamine transferase, SPINDLY family protein n=1 Tax=Dyella sp. TaxID=1869338 RepID=UPI002ED130A7